MLSPILFNIALGKIVREATLNKKGVELGEKLILAFADDIVFMVKSRN